MVQVPNPNYTATEPYIRCRYQTLYTLQVLNPKYAAGSKSSKPLKYTSFGAACSEVEVDLLTGEKTVLQSDLYFDCGRSLNPAVDIGQVSIAQLSLPEC